MQVKLSCMGNWKTGDFISYFLVHVHVLPVLVHLVHLVRHAFLDSSELLLQLALFVCLLIAALAFSQSVFLQTPH